ncbi:unnamed protein product, partial [Polarella glacialis]
GFAHCSRWAEAFSWLQTAKQRGIQVGAVLCSATLRSCESNWREALALLEDAQHEHRVRIRRGAPTRAAEVQAGVNYLHEMSGGAELRLQRQMPGLRPPAEKRPGPIAYNAMITAFERCCQWEKAAQMFGELRGYGLAPDVVSYNAAINAYTHGGHWEQVLVLLDDLRLDGLEATPATLSSALGAFAAAGAWELGLLLWSEFQHRGLALNVVAHGALIN